MPVWRGFYTLNSYFAKRSIQQTLFAEDLTPISSQSILLLNLKVNSIRNSFFWGFWEPKANWNDLKCVLFAIFRLATALQTGLLISPRWANEIVIGNRIFCFCDYRVIDFKISIDLKSRFHRRWRDSDSFLLKFQTGFK